MNNTEIQLARYREIEFALIIDIFKQRFGLNVENIKDGLTCWASISNADIGNIMIAYQKIQYAKPTKLELASYLTDQGLSGREICKHLGMGYNKYKELKDDVRKIEFTPVFDDSITLDVMRFLDGFRVFAKSILTSAYFIT